MSGRMQRDHAAGKQLFGVAHYAPLCYGISCLEPHQEFGNDVHVALLWKGYDTRQMYSINLVTVAMIVVYLSGSPSLGVLWRLCCINSEIARKAASDCRDES